MKQLILVSIGLLFSILFSVSVKTQQRSIWPHIANKDRVTPLKTVETKPAPLYMSRCLYLKLLPSVPNSRTNKYFGLAALDSIMARIGLKDRKPLFPMAMYGGDNPLGTKDSEPRHYDRSYVISFAKDDDALAICKEIKATGLVEYAEPSIIMRALFTPNDTLASAQYWISIIQAEKGWDLVGGDSNIVIGLIDSGTDWRHSDLRANIAMNAGEIGLDSHSNDKRTNYIDDDNDGYEDNYVGWDFIGDVSINEASQNIVKPDNDPQPVIHNNTIINEHGTGTAGCASAVTNNVAGIASTGMQVKILPLKCSPDQTGPIMLKTVEALTYAADHGANVINCSWGQYLDLLPSVALQAVVDAVNYALDKGIVVVAAAGNDALNVDRRQMYPAAIPGVLSVGATNEVDQVASFSNIGSSVRVFAPGQDIEMTYPNNSYTRSNGTSFSTPMVAGVAAHLMRLHPDWTVAQTTEQLRVSGDTMRDWSPTHYRRLNMYRALTMNKDLKANTNVSPGIVLDSYTLDNADSATIHSINQHVRVKMQIKNLLAASKNLVISSDPRSVISISGPQSVGVLQTNASTTLEFDAFINPAIPPISEGIVDLDLHVSDGGYSDYLVLPITIKLQIGMHELFGTEIYGDAEQTLDYQIVNAKSDRNVWLTGNLVASGSNPDGAVVSYSSDGQTFNDGTYIPQTSSPAYLLDFFAPNANCAWIVSYENGATSCGLLSTTDKGSTWTDLGEIPDFMWAQTRMRDSINGYLCGYVPGAPSGIYSTTSDGGAHWQKHAFPDTTINNVRWSSQVELTPTSVYACTWATDTLSYMTVASSLYRSNDNGKSWVRKALFDASLYPASFQFFDDKNGLMFLQQGTDGLLKRTNDGGDSWHDVDLHQFTHRNLSIFRPYAPVLALVPNSKKCVMLLQADYGFDPIYLLLRSDDYGATWSQIPAPNLWANPTLSAAAGPDQLIVWATNEGAVRRTITSLSVDVNDDTRGALVQEQGLHIESLAPIPASDQLSLRFNLTELASLSVSVYNELGECASRAKLGTFGIGPQTITMDITHLAVGNYFVVVSNGKQFDVANVPIVR